MELPLVFRYQQALTEFREGRQAPDVLLKRMSELIALLDLTSSLGTQLSGAEILDAILLTTMGELGAASGGIFVRRDGGLHELRVARGLGRDVSRLPALDDALCAGGVVTRASGRGAEVLAATGLELLCPVERGERRLAIIGVGPRASGRPYDDDDIAFLRSVAACSATPVENGFIHDELRRVNRRLSVKVFQLNSLFDISRELVASLDEETIKSLTVTTVMGHLTVSRCALYLVGPEGLSLAHERGLHTADGQAVIPPPEALPTLAGLAGPRAVRELPASPLRQRLESLGLCRVVPLIQGGACAGLLALGERVAGTAFGEEDDEFVQTLGRQALAALENVRLQRMQVEKQRQDRELQIAREIQRSLFPLDLPAISGFAVAAATRPCHEVGGDYYDVIGLGQGLWAIVIADVSGKGVPASILMASLHASLHALAGTADPATTLTRLNRFLYESTQPSRFATVFYAELDETTRWLRYVNGGHVPPYHVSRGGSVSRLEMGGPAVGLLEGVGFEVGSVRLAPGDLVAMVTDGATEARSPDDEEFGDERVLATLAAHGRDGAEAALAALFQDVGRWTGPAGCSDDLTAFVLEAR